MYTNYDDLSRMLETRIPRNEDASFLYEVYCSTRMDDVSAWGWGEKDIQAFLSMQWTMQQCSYQLHYPDAQHFIISYEGLDAGRLMLHRTKDMIRLIDISLLPSYRNRGIGGALLKSLQRDARKNQQILVLQVTPHNPARRLYERLGFQTVESSDIYWTMVWRPMLSNVDI